MLKGEHGGGVNRRRSPVGASQLMYAREWLELSSGSAFPPETALVPHLPTQLKYSLAFVETEAMAIHFEVSGVMRLAMGPMVALPNKKEARYETPSGYGPVRCTPQGSLSLCEMIGSPMG